MRYSFDQFALDSTRFELSENGNAVHVEPQVIELLIYLVRNRGRLITRDELIQAVWKGRVVSDSAVSGRIKVARKALGDDGKRQRYIRTIHKKGFFFSAGDLVEEAANGSPTSASDASSEAPRSARRRRKQARAIGVLGFANAGANGARRFIADGITEDLITTLSKISTLRVVALPNQHETEMQAFDARQAGRQFGVPFVLCGSVRAAGDRLRISVHLVDSQSGQYLWAQRYDRPDEALFALQDEISKEVVSALQVELTEGDQALLLSRGTDNIEAWQLTFQGQAAVLEHHQDSVRRGLIQLQKAVGLDSQYALAWSALAAAHWKESLNQGWSESRAASLQLSVQASDRALALQPGNASILAMRSLILVSRREFEAATDMANRALHLANSEANTIALAGITLRYCCLPELAIRHTRKAMALSPIYPAWYPYGIAICYWMMGALEPAVEYLEQAIEIDPDLSLNYIVQAMIHAETGQRQKLRDAVDAILRIDPKFSSRALTEGLPFSDPEVQARRARALQQAGIPA